MSEGASRRDAIDRVAAETASGEARSMTLPWGYGAYPQVPHRLRNVMGMNPVLVIHS